MPPPPSIPRETRSQTRKSRMGSEGAESIESPGSTRKAVTTPRRKPNVRAKPSSNYGAAVDSQAPAQKQAVKLAKIGATDRIEAGVSAAIERSVAVTTNNTRGLTPVTEEDEHGAVQERFSPREEERVVFNNSGDGDEDEGIYHHPTAFDLAGSKSPRRAHLNDLSNRQKVRANSQQPAALNHPAAANQDATSTQPIRAIANEPAAALQDATSAESIHPNHRDMLPPALQTPIPHPALTNSPVTTAPVTHRGVHMPWARKWIWLGLIISLIISISSAAFSTVRYQQMTTSFSEFQNSRGKEVSSIIPPVFFKRLDKLEEQVTRLAENAANAAMKEARSHQINWFSFDLGARANPYLSSPSTRNPKLKMKSRWRLGWKDIKSAWKSSSQQEQRADGYLAPFHSRGGPRSSGSSINPNTALTPYKELEARYCAPSDRRGILQLAVSTPRPITPTELVVEHFHRDQVPLIGNAPKEIELWVEIKDDADAKLREEIRRRIKEIHPDIFSRDSRQKDRRLDPKLALGDQWVPVGRWVYQISPSAGGEPVQYFKIPLDLAAMGVVVQQQVVRVNSNWGNVDRTCLVR
ncbi:hypothetical protein MMC31_005578, partial [Peltigera leucophlebia]|nr:hypothetical protein [Peltigera leucophlebia]